MRIFSHSAFSAILAIYLSATPAASYLCLGCWTGGNPLPALLPGPNTQPLSNVTVHGCAAHCAGWWLFALEGGNSCYCGKTINLDINRGGAAPVAGKSCSVACSGNANQTCGGEAGKSFDLYVYAPAINSFDAPITDAIARTAIIDAGSIDVAARSLALNSRSLEIYTSLGCWKEGYNLAMIFMGWNWIGMPGMTVERCAFWCSGYPQFAVRGADQCFCGTTLVTADQERGGAVPDSSTDCHSECAGDPIQDCGGWGGDFHLYTFSNDSISSSESTTAVMSLETLDQSSWQSTSTIDATPLTFVTEQRVPSSTPTKRPVFRIIS